MQNQSLDSLPEASSATTSEPSTAMTDAPVIASREGYDASLNSSPGRNEPIHDKLWARTLPDCRDSAKKFLPLDAQEEIINADSVRRELSLELDLSPTELDELVNFICPDKLDSACSRRGTKLFAVLSLIDQPSSISVFQKEGISDSHLPFRRDGRNELIPRNYSGSFDFFKSWKTKAVNDFENYQWCTLTPFLQPLSLGSLDDGITLPWNQYSHFAEGGQSSVYKVKIHDSHHSFPKKEASVRYPILTPGGSTYFALKELKSKESSILRRERDSFRKSGQHQHLIELLTSFQHKGSYYLLFPWAYGGTLKDLWEKSHPTPAYVDTEWVAQQAHGLVDGLFRVHHVKSNHKSIEAALGEDQEDDDKVFGRHGDIKRDNVLVFLSERKNEGVLKLSDFGLTVFHSTMSRSTDRPASIRPCGLAYRGPEAEAERSDNRLSPRYDIWCLGCLYLDMVTWLLLGSKGLEEFLENRLREKVYPVRFETEYFWKSTKRSRGSLGPPAIKSSAIYWIRYLQGLEQCTDYLYDLLDYIENSMLLCETKRPQAV
ncbi:hypothetical protein PG994_014770 [Apiospora phragmitis]|uniref:Protein kinase domain-containing protein n=1 Tax=Apiospora phragmitis TaxID=2905665 RepID=A0ABR1SUJ4_9PEZI